MDLFDLTDGADYRWNTNLQYPCLTLTLLDPTTPICITPHGGWPSVAADPSANGGNPVATPTATAPPPGPTAPGTTAQCGEWVFASNGTNCEQLLLNSKYRDDMSVTKC